MDLRLTQEQKLIQSAAREFLEAECPMAHVRAMASDDLGYSPELWRKIAGLGWMGAAIPERHGGLGTGFFELCLLIEETGRARLPAPYLSTTALVGMPLLKFGNEQQKSYYLPAIAAGRLVLTYAHHEPGGGWGLGGGCTASLDNGELVLNGTKLFVPYANAADEILIVAGGEGAGADELTLCLVQADAPGLSYERLDTVGLDHLYRLELDSVRVPMSRVLGAPGDGGTIAEAIARWGAAGRCAEMVGAADRVLAMTVAYAQERVQFGRPIGSFQAVQHHCANMAIDVLGARYITYEAVWHLDKGTDAAEVVSIAKAFTGDAYRRVCSAGHQVHGAIGYTAEHDMHFYSRHAVAADLAFGDADYHRERVAAHTGL